MNLVDEFYIIADSGLCLYSKSRKDQVDQTLFSGFLTALNSLSEEISSRNIDSLTLKNEKYIISKLEHLYFIVRTSPKAKDSEIRKILAEMEQIFLQNFSSKDLEQKWDGNLNKFELLNKKYEKFFIDSVKNRMESLF